MITDLTQCLQTNKVLRIRQRFESLETFLDFETRNKYAIELEDGLQVGFAAEQQKGFFGAIARQFFGHWRSFTIHIFDMQRRQIFTVDHPFRFYFQQLTLRGEQGEALGTIEKEFSILTKKFKLLDAHGRVLLRVASPIWRIWTFNFIREDGREAAKVTKRWSGLLKEAFSDADNFELAFSDETLSLIERQLLLAAALFIDLQYFERKGRSANLLNW